MDHLTAGRSETPTGRGQERGGALPATDLLGERGEHRGGDLEADEACGEGLIPARMSTLLTIAALCLALLCGATAAISAIIAHSPRDPGAFPRPDPVAGAETFRPDLLHGARWPFAAEPGPRGGSEPGPREPAPESPKFPPSGEIRSPERAAAAFYALLDADPERAVDMLSPELVGDQRDEIVGSWREITSARAVRVQPGPDGSVLAEVVVEYPDGSRIALRHELVIVPLPQVNPLPQAANSPQVGESPEVAAQQSTGHQHIVGARLRTAHLVPAR